MLNIVEYQFSCLGNYKRKYWLNTKTQHNTIHKGVFNFSLFYNNQILAVFRTDSYKQPTSSDKDEADHLEYFLEDLQKVWNEFLRKFPECSKNILCKS